MRRLILITFFYALGQQMCLSQTCCSGGVPVSGNIGLFPMPAGNFQINLAYDYNSLATLKNYSEIIPGSERRRLTQSLLFEASYSFTDRLSLYAFVSYVSQLREIKNQSFFDQDLTRGAGDAVLMPGYLAIDNYSVSWLLSAGVKFPAGKSDLRDDRGILYNPDLQPGSGAYDALFLSMLRFSGKKGHSYFHSVAFRRTGTNHNFRNNDKYRFGNELVASIGWSSDLYMIKQVFEPSLNITYRYAGKDLLNAKVIPNTGGNWLFADVGIAMFLRENLKIFSSLSFPVYSEPAGIQLSTSLRINTGVYFSFSKPKNEIQFKNL